MRNTVRVSLFNDLCVVAKIEIGVEYFCACESFVSWIWLMRYFGVEFVCFHKGSGSNRVNVASRGAVGCTHALPDL